MTDFSFDTFFASMRTVYERLEREKGPAITSFEKQHAEVMDAFRALAMDLARRGVRPSVIESTFLTLWISVACTMDEVPETQVDRCLNNLGGLYPRMLEALRGLSFTLPQLPAVSDDRLELTDHLLTARALLGESIGLSAPTSKADEERQLQTAVAAARTLLGNLVDSQIDAGLVASRLAYFLFRARMCIDENADESLGCAPVTMRVKCSQFLSKLRIPAHSLHRQVARCVEERIVVSPAALRRAA